MPSPAPAASSPNQTPTPGGPRPGSRSTPRAIAAREAAREAAQRAAWREETTRRRAAGEFLRTAALCVPGQPGRVRVLFLGPGDAQRGAEMAATTYHAFPLMAPVSETDFAALEPLTPAPATFDDFFKAGLAPGR